jgi:hypothetical protein
MTKIATAGIGAGSITLMKIANQLGQVDTSTAVNTASSALSASSSVISYIVQAVIAIATLIKLFKKKKSTDN